MQLKSKLKNFDGFFVTLFKNIFKNMSAAVHDSVIMHFILSLFSNESVSGECSIIRLPIKKSSVFSKILNFRVFFAGKFENSLLGGSTSSLYRSFLSLPLRTVAIFLLTFGIMLMLGSSLTQNGLTIAHDLEIFYTGITMTAISIIILPTKKNISSCIEQSKLLSNFSHNSISVSTNSDEPKLRGYSSAFFFGIMCAFVSYFVVPSNILMFMVALFCTCAVFSSPEAGVLMCATLLPILSTGYIIYIVFVTFLSYILKYLRGKRHFNTRGTDILLFLAITVLLFSGIFTISGTTGIKHSVKLTFCIILMILISNLVRSTKTTLKCTTMLTRGAFAVSVFNIVFFILQYSKISAELSLHFSVTDFIGVVNIFSGQNELGVFSSTIVPIVFSSIVYAPMHQRPKNIVLLTMLFSNIIISGNSISFFISIISLLIVLSFKNKLWLLLTVPCGMFFKFIMSVPSSILNFAGLSSLGSNNNITTDYHAIIKILSEYGIFGMGLGNENRRNAISAITGYRVNDSFSTSLSGTILFTLGIFGLTFLMILVLAFMSKPYKYIKSDEYKDNSIRIMCIGLLTSCISFILTSLLSYTASDTRLIMLFMMCLGLSCSAVRSSRDDHISEYVIREHLPNM